VPVPLAPEEKMIVPLIAFAVPLKFGMKVSNAVRLLTIGPVVVPSSVNVIGTEFVVGGLPVGGPLVVSVVVVPEVTALTKSICGFVGDSANPRMGMTAAPADMDSANEAAHAAANRVSEERMVLLLPL